MLTLKVLPNVRDVTREAWDALVQDTSSPFVEWTWLDCLEEAGCVGSDAGWMPNHLALYQGKELVAAAPLYVKASSEGEFVFDWSWADLASRLRIPYYPKIVVAVPFTPATGDRVLVREGFNRREVIRLFAAASREWAEEVGVNGMHVLFPRADEAKSWEEEGLIARAGFQFQFFADGAKTFDDYLSRFNSKRRNQIKREVAQPGKQGIVIRTLAPEELTRDMAHTMFRIYATTVDKFFYGQRYLNTRFFELVAERFRHRLAWVVAEKEGRVIAGAFNVVGQKRLYGRYWGALEDHPFLHFAVCYYHGVHEALSRGLEAFEPGAGGEHKRVRGFVPTLTHSAHWIRSERLRGILAPHVERERERVLELVARGGDEDDT